MMDIPFFDVPMPKVIVTQTKLAAIGYFMVFASTLIVFASSGPMMRNKSLLNLIAMVISIPLALYGINCSVVGNCNNYAWIYSYAILVWGFLATLLLLFSFVKP